MQPPFGCSFYGLGNKAYLNAKHLERAYERYERYTTVITLAQLKKDKLEINNEMLIKLNKINIKEDYGYIRRQANVNDLDPDVLMDFIDEAQQSYRRKLYAKLQQ